MLECGAPPAADATPADADPLLESTLAEEDHALELVDLARPRQRRPTRDLVRHRVMCRRNWKAGDRVQLRVSGVDLECTVPDGATPGQEFVARVERARLPSLIALDRRDFDAATQRVWRPPPAAQGHHTHGVLVRWEDEAVYVADVGER